VILIRDGHIRLADGLCPIYKMEGWLREPLPARRTPKPPKLSAEDAEALEW
jgi:hypothetical protein